MKKLIQNNRYILLLLYMPVYLISFFTIDRLELDHYVIRCSLDALIPFQEYFVIPYSIWFIWFTGFLGFFLWHALGGRQGIGWYFDPKIPDTKAAETACSADEIRERELAKADFIKVCIVMFTSMTISLITYLVWPNAIDLREPILRENLCAKAVELIRSSDTPYGVCPSIHVGTIVVEALVVKDSRLTVLTPIRKTLVYAMTLLIAYSTVAIKQHSIVDVIAGAALAVVLYVMYELFAAKRLCNKGNT